MNRLRIEPLHGHPGPLDRRGVHHVDLQQRQALPDGPGRPAGPEPIPMNHRLDRPLHGHPRGPDRRGGYRPPSLRLDLYQTDALTLPPKLTDCPHAY